jgi:hypothetical protein
MDSNLKNMFDLFYKNCPYSLTKYFLALINNIYCTNLTILIKIPQNDKILIKRIIDNFHASFDSQKITSLYTFASLGPFSRFKELNIFQNQIFISESLKFETINKANNDIINFFGKTMVEKLKRAMDDPVKKVPLGKVNPYFKNNKDI